MGEFQATGFIPKFIEVLERKGYNVPRGLFANQAQAPAAEGKVRPVNPGNAKKVGQNQKKKKAG